MLRFQAHVSKRGEAHRQQPLIGGVYHGDTAVLKDRKRRRVLSLFLDLQIDQKLTATVVLAVLSFAGLSLIGVQALHAVRTNSETLCPRPTGRTARPSSRT
jgi:hypothetical protein